MIQQLPLNDLHLALGARMVTFAGYEMPVSYPMGLIAEHHHTRTAASLFDVSHMGQLRIEGQSTALALESLIPCDGVDLPVGRQRYGLLLNEAGGIVDDLMMVNRGSDFLCIVNGACKANDTAYLQTHISHRCTIVTMTEYALLALQGPQAVHALARVVPGVEHLVFMTGGWFILSDPTLPLFITRSGYTGEDGFEISVHTDQAPLLAQAILDQPEVQPAGLGARNSLRLEAGLPLYDNDIDATTTPVEAGLQWAIPRVRRQGGAREGGFPGAIKILAQYAEETVKRRRVGLIALDRVPVREHAEVQDLNGVCIGEVTSGLLSPTLDRPIAMAYVSTGFANVGTRVQAIVRNRPIPMEVTPLPFVPHRYYRGSA